MNAIHIDVDLRPLLSTHIFDQGQRPACFPIAVSQAHQAARRGELLAPDALWASAESLGLTSDNGTSRMAMTLALSNPGQPKHSAWPFSKTWPSHQPTGIPAEGWFTGDLNQEPTVLGALHEALGQSEIVVITVEVTPSFQSANQGNDIVDSGGSSRGLHAIICVGHGLSDTGDNYYLVRNSWGMYWGSSGQGWLTEDFVRQHGRLISRISSIDEAL